MLVEPLKISTLAPASATPLKVGWLPLAAAEPSLVKTRVGCAGAVVSGSGAVAEAQLLYAAERVRTLRAAHTPAAGAKLRHGVGRVHAVVEGRVGAGAAI
jgi:hypothetical protein